MRTLRILVVVMGVLIVAGTIGLAVMMAQRVSSPAVRQWTLDLDEPAGTQIVTAVPAGDAVALTLRGGGAERVVVVDARAGRVVGRISLAK